MANKITRTIKYTSIYYKNYGDDDEDVEPINLPGFLSEDEMWKAVKKFVGQKAVVVDYSYNEGKYSMDVANFIYYAVKEED